MQYLATENEAEAIRWMEAAATVAHKALCHKAKCGTVVVNNGVIIGQGYNAPALDEEQNRRCDTEYSGGKPKYDHTCCMHAEWRAILDAVRSNPAQLVGSKLYFTRIDNVGRIKKSGQPYCTVCSRLALDTGISHFVLWHEEGIAEYPTDEYDLLSYQYQNPTSA